MVDCLPTYIHTVSYPFDLVPTMHASEPPASKACTPSACSAHGLTNPAALCFGDMTWFPRNPPTRLPTMGTYGFLVFYVY